MRVESHGDFISTSGRWSRIQRAKPSLRRRAWPGTFHHSDLDSRGAEGFKTIAGNGGVGVDGGGDDAGEAALMSASVQGGVRPVMQQGSKRDVGRAAPDSIIGAVACMPLRCF